MSFVLDGSTWYVSAKPVRLFERIPWWETETSALATVDDDKTKHFHDQLAWLSKPKGSSLLKGLTYGQRTGTFDFIPHVLPGLTRSEVLVDLRPLP